jgi:hypothetical protein
VVQLRSSGRPSALLETLLQSYVTSDFRGVTRGDSLGPRLDWARVPRQLWTPARNRAPQMPPTQACAIQTPELLRPRKKIRESGYIESQSEDATASRPANPDSRLNQVLSSRLAPPLSNQGARYFGRTFQNSENKTNRGTFKRCEASRNCLLPLSDRLAHLCSLPVPFWNEAGIQIPLPTIDPGSARPRGTEGAKRGWELRLGAGTLFLRSTGRASEDPSARSHAPRPLGASQTQNKNKGFAQLRRLRRSREEVAVQGGRWAPLRSKMQPGLWGRAAAGRSDAGLGVPLRRLVPELGDGSGRPRRAGPWRRGRHGEWASRVALGLVAPGLDRGLLWWWSPPAAAEGLTGAPGCSEAIRWVDSPGASHRYWAQVLGYCSLRAYWTPHCLPSIPQATGPPCLELRGSSKLQKLRG